ncbi:MAG: M48 family metalloprotease [Pyrinomonadaceae bacterium]
MTKSTYRSSQILMAWLLAVCIFAMPVATLAQTRIGYRPNKYSPNDDVKAGQQAASEVERQLPISRDGVATDYLRNVGERLVAAIPQEFQHPEFRYSFKLVDVRDVNAFALPGGYMYVNRGIIDVARNEGELAGVMAHELSHVALRHGTAQATKAQSAKVQAPAIGGAILGAILGGGIGQVVSGVSQQAAGAYFLKFSREYETEADILGAQMMARAGYDPRDLANMFKTLEQQSGGRGGPEFLSSHPNPANRYARIEQEARQLRVNNPVQNTAEFNNIKARLNGNGRAPSMSEIARNGQRYPHGGRAEGYPGNSSIGGRVEPPSTRFRTYTAGNVRVSVPDNWRELPDQNSVWFAPEGGYGQAQQSNSPVFTHGAEIGFSSAQSNDLQRETQDFVNALAQSNQNLRQQNNFVRGNISGRNALAVTMSNVNDATGQRETVTIYTALVRGGGLFHMITVTPQNESGAYQNVFQNILRSIQLSN